jgi:hypothetical protein
MTDTVKASDIVTQVAAPEGLHRCPTNADHADDSDVDKEYGTVTKIATAKKYLPKGDAKFHALWGKSTALWVFPQRRQGCFKATYPFHGGRGRGFRRKYVRFVEVCFSQRI